MQASSSMAPVAPMQCPCIDFVDEIASLSAWAPKTCATAALSVRSFAAVPVPWALM